MLRSFKDRRRAGEELGNRLWSRKKDLPIVVALPRGGVPVAFEVAKTIGAPMDVIVVKKIGAPGRPELGVGAVGEDGAFFVDEELITRLGRSTEDLIPSIEAAETSVARERALYRGSRPPLDLRDRVVIVVDDGIATGGTMRAALQIVKARGAARTIVAVPVAGPESLARLAGEADEIVCLEVSPLLWAVGLAYEHFEQIEDATVRDLLEAAAEHRSSWTKGHPPAHEVTIDVGKVSLQGDFTVPKKPLGLVIFAHGSGSNRKSRRNRLVARYLQEAGIATLLFDLLSIDEIKADEIDARYRYDIRLLSSRMVGAIDWARRKRIISGLPLAVYGASTGAAAALAAAAERTSQVSAVVSRGGRPDLAQRWLSRVKAPCLLIVGERDVPILEIHADNIEMIPGYTHLVVVHGAGHLFEEPGAIDEVARRTTEFVRQQFQPQPEIRA